MIFEFKLSGIEDVQPWGEAQNKEIHWFALTQGDYRLKAGSEYLLNYSEKFVKYLKQKFPENTIRETTFVDYYVVRLWEDLIEILPNALEPVPEEFRYFFESDYKTQASWFEKVNEWHDQAELNKDRNNDEIWEIDELATYWLQNRYFDTGYLSPSARIWIWSDENDVIISWDNQEVIDEGIQVWSAIRGNYRIARDEFIKEIERFNKELFTTMQHRVDEICRTWKNDEIRIDFEQLISEQKNRSNWLNATWIKSLPKAKTDWSKVKAVINLINP